MAQHVFRSPAIIAAKGAATFVVVPDLGLCGAVPANPWFMDLDAPAREFSLGLGLTELIGHVHYHRKPGMTLGPGRVELGFFIAAYRDENKVPNPWAEVTRFLWDRHARPLYAQGEPLIVPMDRYVEHTYRWAFHTWKEPVWQQFKLGGKQVGSPCFIVNVTESPNYPGEVNLREFLSIWNQAWFSSLRAASGLWRYAARTDDAELRRKAGLTKEFSLAAPFDDGLFPSVYGTGMTTVEIEGREYARSKGWKTGRWMNSNRVPWERGVTPDWYHVLDASWTALLMLRWHEELEADPRLVEYAQTYARTLLALQDEAGFFPAWLHPETHEPSEVLAQSPETSMSVTFLLKVAESHARAGRQPEAARCQKAALRAMDAVIAGPVPEGRWEDFETYWSCCPWGREEFLGRRIPRNAMHKQCNFSMFWTAEALLAAYRATGEQRYLDWGRRTLDELSMTQQVWQPPFIHIPALGGFGVMNFDGEWNDSRQCLFAELFMDYYRVTGDPRLFERGVAALKAAFVMMYCPENPQVKQLWERSYPFFGPADYGFTMENYAHGGETWPDGGGMGEFTIYTWGNGAAAEARNRIRDHYGDAFVDRVNGRGFGIDSIAVEKRGDAFVLRDLAGVPRDVRVVFEDGAAKTLRLDGEAAL